MSVVDAAAAAVFQLPRIILHNVYSKWLDWKDLTTLDLACIEKNEREVWLTSLTDLRMSKTFDYVSDSKLRIFYQWLLYRKVFCVDNFPVSLDVLEDLVTTGSDMESYCPTLQSIQLDRWRIEEHSSDMSNIKSHLSVFLSHCHNLQGVTLWMSDSDRDAVLSVLIEKLRENSLVNIYLHSTYVDKQLESSVMVATILKKHATSLRDLYISVINEEDMACIVSTLIDNEICLRRLRISLGDEPSQEIPHLISYLSSSGGLLEDLSIDCPYFYPFVEDLVASIITWCPKVTCLVITKCEPCSIETLRQLYEECPHLQKVSIEGAITTYDSSKSVSIEVKGHSEDWAVCLSHALRRRQYKKVTVRLREEYNHAVNNLKSMLESYHIDLYASTSSETSLISLLQDLPHLNSVHLRKTIGNEYTDATWLAMSKHGKSLTELRLTMFNSYDKQLSKLIKTCQLLKVVAIEGCGWESLVAIWKLSDVRTIDLTMVDSVTVKRLDGLLLDGKVKWSTTLEDGVIKTDEEEFRYEFENTSHCWIKQDESNALSIGMDSSA